MSARRMLAAGVIRRQEGRTTVLVVTSAGVSGRITTPRGAAAVDPDGERAPRPADEDLPTAA
ncbi:hypothetical protein [Kitasatospora sp. NPDC090091]|uniref:hypothetical protein n=1 Tax=Kitasatospora sp. NPDC090091 TaxID=3364081 RepID=UPI00380855F0